MQVGVLFISGFAAGSLRGSGGLVVAAGFEGRVAEEFAGGGVDDVGLKVLDEQDDAGSVVEDGRGDPLPRTMAQSRRGRDGPPWSWVDWYNNRRLFEALGDIPPAEAESAYYATRTPSESPRMAEQTLQ